MMNSNDKKTLALLISYVDDLVEKKLNTELSSVQKLVEQSPLFGGDRESFIVEGPRGPRGFRGPEGEQGPPGEPADPSDVAKELRLNEDFIRSTRGPQGPAGRDADPLVVAEALISNESFLRLVERPMGPQGPAGKDADPKKVAEQLKRSKFFREEVRGEPGPQGPMGSQGPIGLPGIGIAELHITEEGNLDILKTDGTLDSFKLPIPGKYDDTFVKNEVEKIKKEIQRIRSDVTAQITRSIMAAGGSAGGGEVRIEFMDDFVRESLVNGHNKPVLWNEVLHKFQVAPLSIVEGVISYKTTANPYLIGNGTSAIIDKSAVPLLVNELYSLYVVDPIDDQVIEVSVYSPEKFIQIDSNESLYDKIFYLNYMQRPLARGPFPLDINVNSYISADGLRVEIPFVDFNIHSIETIRLLDSDKDVSVETILSDRIIFESNVPMFGMVTEMMVNYNEFQGCDLIDINLTGLSFTIDFAAYGIENLLNHMIVNNTTNELEDVVVYLTDNYVRFESSFDMSGMTAKIWYKPV